MNITLKTRRLHPPCLSVALLPAVSIQLYLWNVRAMERGLKTLLFKCLGKSTNTSGNYPASQQFTDLPVFYRIFAVVIEFCSNVRLSATALYWLRHQAFRNLFDFRLLAIFGGCSEHNIVMYFFSFSLKSRRFLFWQLPALRLLLNFFLFRFGRRRHFF